jgi:CubicO group peptidase (beta-lactamase class C family)
MPSPMLTRRLGLLMTGAALGGTLARRAQAAPMPPPPEMAGAPVSPRQIDQAIRGLDSVAPTILRKTRIPGMAVAVVRGGKTVYVRGFGVRRVGAPDQVTEDTVFQIASLSKAVGASVVAGAVRRKVIAWDTPVVRHLPWFALSDDWVTRHVTIGDLYAHRSGLPDHAGDDLEDVGYDRRGVLERLRYLPLHPFRDHYAYTNFGLTAAAESVAAAAGTDWASLSEATIYRPLGMTATSSRFADFMRRDNRAFGHVKVGDAYQPKYQRDPDAQSPAGGVSSSVADMARWMAMVLAGGTLDGKTIVEKAALLPAVTGQTIASPSASMAARAGLYGYGFGVGTLPSGRVALSHSGAFAMGAATNFLMIPSLDLGIVVLSNAGPVGAVEAVSAGFADLVQFGTVTRDWLAAYAALFAPMSGPFGALSGKPAPAHPAAAAALASYAGTYANDYVGAVPVALSGGALVLKIGPSGMAFPLRPWDGNTFVYTPTGENAPDGSVSKATFTMDATGRASGLSLEYFAGSGEGDLVRRPA